VLWRPRHKVNPRDLVEMSLKQGFSFIYEIGRVWEERVVPLLATHL